MSDTLVLNKNYCAIHVVSWQKSMTLMYQGLARAVDEDLQSHNFEDWVELSSLMEKNPKGFVHSSTMRVAVPEVILLTKYDKLPKKEVKFSRKNIYSHYKYKCSYCGKRLPTSELNLDHVIPRSRGGQTNWDNIVLSCIPCNSRKRDRTPREAGMKLLVKPSRPKWKSINSSIVQSPIPIPVSWQNLLDCKYWDSELES